MKTYNSIIQLTFVPETLSRETNGDIAEGMFLCSDAVDALLKGDMFSPLDCLYRYASVIDEKDALKAIAQLTARGIVGRVIILFPHC